MFNMKNCVKTLFAAEAFRGTKKGENEVKVVI